MFRAGLSFAVASILIACNAKADIKVYLPQIKSGTVPMESVFNGFGCTGQNISPELKWSGVPEETKSIAVTVYDPDAPTGSGWWHWLAFNLPPTTTMLASGAGDASGMGLPVGAIQSRTDFGSVGYGGPCPPVGDKPHRYIFTVFALKSEIPLKADSSGALVGYYLNQNKVASGSVTATFGR